LRELREGRVRQQRHVAKNLVAAIAKNVLKKIFVKLFGAKHNNWTKNAQLSEKENP
jgi:hypothetical protein